MTVQVIVCGDISLQILCFIFWRQVKVQLKARSYEERVTHSKSGIIRFISQKLFHGVRLQSSFDFHCFAALLFHPHKMNYAEDFKSTRFFKAQVLFFIWFAHPH